jgi:hypothetical protein
MKKDPVLVVMAAGMGSRYGGLKQIEPMGSQGEAILDYSLYDAYRAGFRTAVIIIKDAIKKDFMDTVGKRLMKCPLEIRYAYQELTMLPDGYCVPEGRTKPWGTTHAVLCAKDAFVLRFKNKGSLFTVGILMLIVLSALAGGMFISSLFYYLSAISVVAFGMLGYAVSYMQCEKQENQ